MEEEKQQKEQRFHCSVCDTKASTEGSFANHKSRAGCNGVEVVCIGIDCPKCKSKSKLYEQIKLY